MYYNFLMPQIHYKNMPRLSEHEIDKISNDRRIALAPLLESFLASDEMFVGKDISVEYSHKGVSALVVFIEAGADKYVLKIALKPNAEGEALFLKKWEEIGIKVPHVYKEGKLGNHHYILMSFINAPMLSESMNNGLVKSDIWVDLGKILCNMHKPGALGYGRLVGGKAEYTTFKGWIMSEKVQEKIKYVEEAGLLDTELWPISNVIDTLVAYNERNPKSSYCHMDFCADDIMASVPPTIIDPEPMFNNGIIDLGCSIQVMSAQGNYDHIEDLKEGYFSNNESHDQLALRAAIILSAYMKFRYWHKTGRDKEMAMVRKYLTENCSVK
jgi:fructosamine-3-kinase